MLSELNLLLLSELLSSLEAPSRPSFQFAEHLALSSAYLNMQTRNADDKVFKNRCFDSVLRYHHPCVRHTQHHRLLLSL